MIVDTKIDVYRTCIKIHPYTEDNREQSLEKQYSVFDPNIFKITTMGFYYDEENQTMIFPRSVSIRFLERVFNTTANVHSDHDPIEKAIINLTTKPRDEVQKNAIAFITGKKDYKNLSSYSRLMLELDTGVGKTYCVIAAISLLKIKAAIILNRQGLIDQWMEKLQEFTTLNKHEIVVINGKAKVEKLLKGEYSKAKVFLISHKTINVYASNNGWYAVGELFKKMKIGLKVFDEAHLEIQNIIYIDLFTNTSKTVYLTATAKRSSYNENKMFKNIYGPVPVLTQKRTKKEAYVNSLILMYDSKPTYGMQGMVKTKYGLDGNKYSDYLVFGNGREKFFKALSLILNTFKKKEGKIAFLLKRKNAIVEVSKWIKENYPEFKKDVGLYYSDITDKEEKEKQLTKRIILTTYKSFGTGMDISDLHYLVMAEAYSSKVILEQTIGRLRNIGGDLCYFELVDVGFDARFSQFQSIRKKLLSLSKEATVYKIP